MLRIGDRVRCFPFGKSRIELRASLETCGMEVPVLPDYGVVVDFSPQKNVVFVLRTDIGGGSQIYSCHRDLVEGPMTEQEFKDLGVFVTESE